MGHCCWKKNCSKIASQQTCSSAEKFQYHCVLNGYRNETLEVCAPSRIIFGILFIYSKSRFSFFVYLFTSMRFYSNVYLINLSLRFLGHCVEFNLQGGVIQAQHPSPCNETFPKCDKYYNSSTAYKCNVIIHITLKHNLCHSCHDHRLIDQTPGSGSDLKLKFKNLHFLNVS